MVQGLVITYSRSSNTASVATALPPSSLPTPSHSFSQVGATVMVALTSPLRQGERGMGCVPPETPLVLTIRESAAPRPAASHVSSMAS